MILTSQFKKKTVEPVVYAVTIGILRSMEDVVGGEKEEIYTNLCVDYSLESAVKSVVKIVEKNLKTKVQNISLLGYTCESLVSIVSRMKEIDVVENSTNALMSKIIKTGNKDLFEANKARFNENEILLITESLKE